MTAKDFNKKYKNHLEDKFYGMIIEHEEVLNFLDKEFEKEIKQNPKFKYSQIKLKFGFACVYTNSNKNQEWEKEINKITNYNRL